MSGWALFVAVFLACVVEAVEAVTIVLAAGTARDWRSALTGVAAGLLTLAVLVAILGPAVSAIPLGGLRLFVGGLLLIFGLQWLRKAILRASGYKALHNETEIYARQLAAATSAVSSPAGAGSASSGTDPAGSDLAGTDRPASESANSSGRGSRGRGIVDDWYAFTLAFKGVVLEGLEVVFIVLTFGSNQHRIPLAAVAGAAAVVLVSVAGFAVRAPLARVPENTLKFVVGIMLTGFGTFWGAEGAGARWPGSDAALLVIIPVIAVFALTLVSILRHGRSLRLRSNPSSSATSPASRPTA